MGEAQFFLEQLQKKGARDSSKNHAHFRYNLSAFLGAAKSVIDIAFKEIGIKATEYKKWKKSLADKKVNYSTL